MARPGQEWKHGWVPLTASAAKEKNHGSKPGPKSKIAKMVKQGGSDGTSAAMDDAIRARAGRKSNRAETVAAKPRTPADDVAEATQAIKDGDTARAVNLLTRAMGNAKGAERKAIQAQRAELAKRLMGR